MSRKPAASIVFPALTLMLIVTVISSCTVGLDYRRPETKTIPAAYTCVPDVWKVAAPQAHLAKGNWWETFGDPFLSRLEADAAEANQALKAAYARFNQVRATADVSRSDLFPHLFASFQLEIANNRYGAGLVTYLEVATAQNASLGIERTAMHLCGQQLIAVVALIKSLGGGWQGTIIPAQNNDSNKQSHGG